MDIAVLLFFNLLPLYVLIGLGWLAGRFFNVDRQSLGNLAIYILMPIVALGFVAKVELQPVYAVLPLVVFVLFSGVTLLFYALGKKIYPDNRANLMAMCAGAGNTGYLGLPLVLVLFEPKWVGVYIFAMMGGSIYESTVMYYVANRGSFSVRESLIKLLKFPTIYAITLGLLLNLGNIEFPALIDTYWSYFKGAYVVIGMMIIGAALAKNKNLVVAPRFIGLTFLGKFMVWPLGAWGLIALDSHLLGWFTPEIHQMLILMAIVPPAANIAAFAAQLNMNPEKAATTILLGTVFGLFYIPFFLMISGL